MRAESTLPTRTSFPTCTAGPAILLTLFLTLFLTLGLAPATPAIAGEDIDRIVLRVNNQVATLFDYDERKAVEITRILSNPNLGPNQRQEQLDDVGKNVMQNLFGELLLLSFAEQQSIRVKNEEVEEALQQVMQRQGMESKADLQQALDDSGMTLGQLKKNLRNDLLWNQVVGREVHSKIELGEEDLRAYYRNNLEQFEVPERRWLKEILVLETSQLAGDQLADKAAAIHRELTTGGDFEEVAASYKEQEITTGVIDLDWLTEDELEATLATAAWQLKPGEFSSPVEGRGGLHIFYLADLEQAQVRPFKEVEQQIMARERSIRFQKQLREFMARVQKQAYVQENLPPEAVGYHTVAEGFEPEDELGGFLLPLEKDGEEDDVVEEGVGEESGE